MSTYRQFAELVTPFDSRGNLDERVFVEQVRRVSAAGVGICVGSSGVGEGHTMSLDELGRLYALAVQERTRTVDVFAGGREPRTAREVLEQASVAESAGVDALQVYPVDVGHGERPTGSVASAGYVGGVIGLPAPAVGPGRELEAYFSEVLDGVRLPVVICSHSAPGYVVPVDLLDSLVEKHDRIVAVAVGVTSNRYLARVVDAVGHRLPVYVDGCPDMLDNLIYGGQGCIDYLANLVPRFSKQVGENFIGDKKAEATKDWALLMRLHLALTTDRHGNRLYGPTRAVKAAMQLLGLPGGELRPPLQPMPGEAQSTIEQALDEMNVRTLV